MKMNRKSKLIIAGASIALVLTSCGKEEKSDTETGDENSPTVNSAGQQISQEFVDVSLEDLPAISGIARSNDATTLRLAVTGTVPNMVDLPDQVDTVMYRGVIAESASATITQEHKSSFERGEAICRLAATNGDVFAKLEGGTLCYMKALPGLVDGVTVTKASDLVTQDELKSLFAQEATSKHVQIKLTKAGQVGQIANIVVAGTDTAPDSYSIKFYMCRKDDSDTWAAANLEEFDIDRAKKTYVRKDRGAESQNGRNFAWEGKISAALKANAAGDLEFDLSIDRVLTRKLLTSEEGGFAGNDAQTVTIDSANTVTTMSYQTGTYDGNANSEKIFAVAEIQGSTSKTLNMPQTGMALERSWDYQGQTNSVSFAGAVEWQDTLYADTSESDFYTAVNAYDFSDTFFATAPTVPDSDLTAEDCDGDGDIVIEWAMDGDGFAEVDKTCGGDSDLRNLSEMCNSTAVQAARNKIFQQ